MLTHAHVDELYLTVMYNLAYSALTFNYQHIVYFSNKQGREDMPQTV